MPRNNADFHNSILYHGSNHPFIAGDVVKPMETPGQKSLGLPAPTHSYATDSPLIASIYGEKIYRVEPLDHEEVEKSRPLYAGSPPREAHYYTSKKGFKVLGEHSGQK